MVATSSNPHTLDSQVVEILGRNRLVDELLLAGLEVALPLRDKGVDLIVYSTGDAVTGFAARPIQMKAATGESFCIDRKYTAFPGLILAYVWNVNNGERPATYALNYAEALSVAGQMGYTKTASWQKGRYDCPSVSGTLRTLLEAHRMTPGRWLALLSQPAETTERLQR